MEASLFTRTFHELWKPNLVPSKTVNSLFGNKKKASKCSSPNKKSLDVEIASQSVTELYLDCNPSAFAVFASIRKLVLELRQHQSNIPSPSSLYSEEDIGSDKIDPVHVPQMMVIGLKSTFELIRETRILHPALCHRVLQALLDIIQCQQPESLRHEPKDIIEPLFDTLLDFATGEKKDHEEHSLSVTSLAAACLLSLTVAWGQTGKLLQAASALVMSPAISTPLPMPGIMCSLQRSIHHLLLGESASKLDFLNGGILQNALVHSFDLMATSSKFIGSIVVSDGPYLYLIVGPEIWKIGSGYGGTMAGQVEIQQALPSHPIHALLHVNGRLLLKTFEELLVLDKTNLRVQKRIPWSCPAQVFADGAHLASIRLTEEGFVVQWHNVEHPSRILNEFPINVSRQCIEAFGWAQWDEDQTAHVLPDCPSDVCAVVGGKEFALARTSAGKVYWFGKGAVLGLKASAAWSELTGSKHGRILQVAVGHEGQHALLLAEDGSVYFMGVARRGEDGDLSRRRVAKASKLKRFMGMEGKQITWVAANNGTSALVSSEGQVYMMGKDTHHCDPTGKVLGLEDVQVTQVTLGKAHAVLQTQNGHVYTLGMNNKGQCGRQHISKEAPQEEEAEVESDEDLATGCTAGNHVWQMDACRVCTKCGQCTGFGAACINGDLPERALGTACGCGLGDSGCSTCGICRSCANEAFDALAASSPLLEHEKMSVGHKLPHPQPKVKTSRRSKCEDCKSHGKISKDEGNGVNDDRKLVSLPPGKVYTESPIIQIACGIHHTVLLCANGQVLAFGSNSQGQLGTGDSMSRNWPTAMKLRHKIVQIATGSFHTVLLTDQGHVLTCGTYARGHPREEVARLEKSTAPQVLPQVGPHMGRKVSWVGASGDRTFLKVDERLLTSQHLKQSALFVAGNSLMILPVKKGGAETLGVSRTDGQCRTFNSPAQVSFLDKFVTWDPVYAILWSYCPKNRQFEAYSPAVAERTTSTLPDVFQPSLALPVTSGVHGVVQEQAALHILACLDAQAGAGASLSSITGVEPVIEEAVLGGRSYSKEDFLVVNRFESHGGGWGYSGHSVEAVRFMADTDVLIGGFGLFGGRGEYMGKIKLFDLGLNAEQEGDGELLSETDEVVYECGARQRHPILFELPVPIQAHRWYLAWTRVSGPSSDCGSSGLSMVTGEDQVVFYFKSSKKSNNGTDVNAGQIPQLLYRVVSTDTPTTLHHPTEPVHVLSPSFAQNVTAECFEHLLQWLKWAWSSLTAHVIHNLQLSIAGPSAQAPLFNGGPAPRTATYVLRAGLRLLKHYILHIYPANGTSWIKTPSAGHTHSPADTFAMAEAVHRTSLLLQNILVHPLTTYGASQLGNYMEMLTSVWEECHKSLVTCYHAFYPTGALKWTHLCQLLHETEGVWDGEKDRLVGAVLSSLCSAHVRLQQTLPSLMVGDVTPGSPEKHSSQGPSPAGPDSFNISPGDASYPLLIEHMIYKHKVEGSGGVAKPLQEVVERLLTLVTLPLQHALVEKEKSLSQEVVPHACNFLGRVLAELASQACGNDPESDLPGVRPLLQTPCRFARLSPSRSWNTGNGSPEAIGMSVDRSGVAIAGVGVYGGVGVYEYELELLEDLSHTNDPSQSQRWHCLQIVKGSYGSVDFVPEIVDVKFDKPIPIKENTKYVIRLRNHGGRTSNGDGGLGSVKGPDGTTFTFTASLLSFNGTNHLRGQIPYLLYYTLPPALETRSSELLQNQSRAALLTLTSSVLHRLGALLSLATTLPSSTAHNVLEHAHFITDLIPMVLANMGPVASSQPKVAVELIQLIQQVLPHVAALNNSRLMLAPAPLPLTTSKHYAVIESDHPYRPAVIDQKRLVFPPSVHWITLEFDPQCVTAQPEDSLQLYVPNSHGESENLWPVLKRFSGSNWTNHSIILPGHEVVFSLETASDYLRSEKSQFWGYKCLAVGYEWPDSQQQGLAHLELELSFLAGLCAASLMKRELTLPASRADMEDSAESLTAVSTAHAVLLRKGFALAHPPTIQEALDGSLPYSVEGKEREFLHDLVQTTPSTSGGRLARWLQPQSVLDPGHCSLVFPGGVFSAAPNKEGVVLLRGKRERKAVLIGDGLRAGWPAVLTVLTRDQYGQSVHAPNLKVEVKAVPADAIGGDGRRGSGIGDLATPTDSGTSPSHNGDLSWTTLSGMRYEASVKDKMRYQAVTLMKAFENYSFEELRFASPPVRRASETMLVRPHTDGTYSAHWTPSAAGAYHIHVTFDGYPMEEMYQVEVREPPAGTLPPCPSMATRKTSNPPNRLRQYIAQSTAGLRVRSQPSLQGEQIGIVPNHGTISFIEQLRNDDGLWLRLSTESTLSHCKSSYPEAWCLQYHQHLAKTLLFPVDDSQQLQGGVASTMRLRGPGPYRVVKCGASGHNVRGQASLQALPVGMLVMGNQIDVVEEKVTADGVWVRLDPVTSVRQHCFSFEGEAWSLAVSRNDMVYLQHENDLVQSCGSDTGSYANPGFDFGTAKAILPTTHEFSFGQGEERAALPLEDASQPSKATSAAVLVPDKEETSSGTSSRFSVWQKWLRRDDKDKGTDSAAQAIARPPKPHSEPKAASPSTSRCMPPELLGISVKDLVKAIGESRANGNGATPPVSPHSLRKNAHSKPSLSSGEGGVKSRSASPLTSSGTQTSPEVPNKPHFSLGSAPDVTLPATSTRRASPRSSPKNARKWRHRTNPEPPSLQLPLTPSHAHSNGDLPPAVLPKEPIPEALSPSQAAAMRSVFAAVLWHEGVVHDAMAVASFLKFHPSLPKTMAESTSKTLTDVVLRPQKNLSSSARQQKARQRHSVEVSSANYGQYKTQASPPQFPFAPPPQEVLDELQTPDANPAPAQADFNAPQTRNPGNSVLPPALCLLVRLWEGLAQATTRKMEQEVLSTPSWLGTVITPLRNEPRERRSVKKKKAEPCACAAAWESASCENCAIPTPQPRSSASKRAKKKAAAASNANSTPGPAHALELHLVMRNNAMFLLDLASASDPPSAGKSKPMILSENQEGNSFQCAGALQQLQCDGYDGHESSPSPETASSSLHADQHSAPRAIHRSISMLGQPLILAQEAAKPFMVLPRKRNNSSSCNGGEHSEAGLSFLCCPSVALQKLVKGEDVLATPTMKFIVQRVDLVKLQSAMTHALRKSACRVFAMDILQWLLRNVSQPMALHDLLWWLVTALTKPGIAVDEKGGPKKEEAKEEAGRGWCEHPVADLGPWAGEGAQPLVTAFHRLLQTVADVMAWLPMGSPLLQMAVRCWGLHFQPSDHLFLHRSHVFSNISQILSRCEEDPEDSPDSRGDCQVVDLADMTSLAEVECSSRGAMGSSLIDASTETFWESGDEDRGKVKWITLQVPSHVTLHLIALHLDLGRDLANKVSNVTLKAGTSAEDWVLVDTKDVEMRFAGWIRFNVPQTSWKWFKLELKGPDNSLRVRQVKLLGPDVRPVQFCSATVIQQRNCEAETLSVFRLLTSQVFGRLLSGQGNENVVEDSNDLKEHMVGILFSGSKLTQLQKQVCAHIVQGISTETQRLKEEWDLGHDTPISDVYCFELLSQVLALSGSSVGRHYLAQQKGLVMDLLSLLHTGSARIQRQVVLLLRRVLPEIPPSQFAALLPIEVLPPMDFSIASSSSPSRVSDPRQLGLLDVFLACLAKALTVQMKVHGPEGTPQSKNISSVALSSSISLQWLETRWWLKGSMTRPLADSVSHLLRDMANGALGPAWVGPTKAAIAECIVALTKVEPEQRHPNECLHNPALWLALAALCVIDTEHVEKLSSVHWAGQREGQERPLCFNHDDGETVGVMLCAICGHLCAECDRVLHLPKKNRQHQRQVCKEEEEAIRVDWHEGCGRIKLFWLLALADARNAKAMLDFRSPPHGATAATVGTLNSTKVALSHAPRCRFCGGKLPLGLGNSAFCSEPDCQEHSQRACSKVLPCSHACGGVEQESQCLPCLQGCSSIANLKQDADDMCMICFTDAVSAAPAIQLGCGHVFHWHCGRNVLTKKWAGPRITFGFSLCPICKVPIDHEQLMQFLAPIRDLYADVRRKALMRLEYEGLDVTSKDPAVFAMERYAYYVCFKCKKAYYGGEARCEVEAGPAAETFDESELVCGGCSDVSRAQMCPRHGTDFLEYKCRYCCSVAVFFCFGTTHFCNACHDDFRHLTELPKHSLPTCPAGPKGRQLEGEECPLHVQHPPTGEEFALGCGVCRNAHTF